VQQARQELNAARSLLFAAAAATTTRLVGVGVFFAIGDLSMRQVRASHL